MATLEFAEIRTRSRGTDRGQVSGPPPRRSTRGTLLLPPWTRAPLLALHQPSVVLAVVAAAAILACAASSASLFLSSSSSEALHRITAAACPDASYPTVTQVPRPKVTVLPRTPIPQVTYPDPAKRERDVPRAMTGAGLPAPTRTIQSRPVAISHGQTVQPTRLFYGDGAIDNISILQRVPGDGLMLPTLGATILAVKPGDSVMFGTSPVKVVGIYKNIFDEPMRPYWCSYTGLGLTPCDTCSGAPPPLGIFTDPHTFNRAYRDLGLAGRVTSALTYQWSSPIETEHLTLTQARRLVDQQNDAYRELGTSLSAQVLAESNLGQLPKMTDQASRIRKGLAGPVVPIAIGGAILALFLVGAAGSYWADRRAREVRLLSSRGVGPAGFATKAALELALPTVIGTALGWLLARGLVALIGPSPDLDPASPRNAAVTAALGLVAGLLLLSLVAGVRARNATERPVGARRSWAAVVPWELLIIAAAVFCYLRLRSEQAVVLDHDVAQVNLLLVTFPLLFLVGAAVLIVRLFTLVLRPLRRRAGRWPAALYLAVSRITAAPVVSVTLLAAVSMPVAMVVYSAGITTTSQYTVEAKTRVFTGSDIAVVSVDTVNRTPRVDRVATIVQRYEGARLGADDVTVLTVDPQTLPRFAFWDDRFAGVPLPTLMSRLATRPHGDRVPALVVGAAPGDTTVSFGSHRVTLDVVGTARVFPGTRLHQPVVVISRSNLTDVGRAVSEMTELWSTRGRAAVEAAMQPQHARTFTVHNPQKVVDVANYLAVTWSFGYLEALAALVGVIAVGGLLLYLATRQRSRAASYALSRRMGLSAGGHLRSMLCELGLVIGVACVVGVALAWSAVLLVYSRMDIDSTRPPEPLLTVPVLALLGAAAASVVVAVFAALFAHRSARRTDVAEVLRLGV